MGYEASADEVRAAGYDAIIACTGSTEKKPPVPGAEAETIYTSEDIYEGRIKPQDLGHHIVMVGGSGVATDTAMYLGSQGKAVTVICRQDALAREETGPHDGLHETFMVIDPEKGYGGMAPAWEQYKDFNVVLKATTTAVTPNSVTYVTKDGETVTVKCDNVIVNGGYKHCTEEALKYAACAPEFYLAGDVESYGGNIQKGNVSAYGKVKML
jgi:thioredoxin reductase